MRLLQEQVRTRALTAARSPLRTLRFAHTALIAVTALAVLCERAIAIRFCEWPRCLQGIRGVSMDGVPSLKGFLFARWEGSHMRVFLDRVAPPQSW